MTPAERVGRALELLGQAAAELEGAEDDAPTLHAWRIGLLRAEIRVSIRRGRDTEAVLRGPAPAA